MVANDASWKLSDFYCEYSKTGTNEGFLIIEYTINIGEMSVEHYEELTLNFVLLMEGPLMVSTSIIPME